MRTWIKVLAIILSFAVSASATASSKGSHFVSASLSHEGEVLASPELVVAAGEPASVEMSGPEAFQLTFIVTDLAEDQIRVQAVVRSSRGSMSPNLVVRPGVAAKVPVGGLELRLTVLRDDG